MKVGIVGTGAVGSACALALVMRGCAREIILVDRTRARAKAVATDMRYGTPLSPRLDLRDGDYGDLAGAASLLTQAVAIEDGLAYTEPPYWYYPVRQSLGAVKLRQGKLDEAEAALRESLARVRNNGWALAALAEVYKRKGDAKAEQSARQALSKAWFGAEGGPDLTKL